AGEPALEREVEGGQSGGQPGGASGGRRSEANATGTSQSVEQGGGGRHGAMVFAFASLLSSARSVPSEMRVARAEPLIAPGGCVDGEGGVAGRVAQRLGRHELAVVARTALVRCTVGCRELERVVRDLVGIADEVGAGVQDER